MIKTHTKRLGGSLPYILILMFLSGIIVGTLFARLSPYGFVFQRATDSKTILFKSSLISFLKPCFIIWLSGFCKKSFFISSVVLAYRGGILGFVTGCMFKEYSLLKGVFASLSVSLPQNLLFFPYLLFLCLASARHKNTNDHMAYLIVLLLSMAVSVFSALVDIYVTSFFIKFIL